MKLTFEGLTYQDVLDQMQSVFAAHWQPPGASKPAPVHVAQGPSPEAAAPVDKGVDKPADNSVKTEKQPDDRMAKMRAAKEAKAAERARIAKLEAEAAEQAKAAAKEAKKKAKAKPAEAPAEEPQQPDPLAEPEAKPGAKEPVDPAKMVAIRQKTIDDLQAAFAGGKQKEVFELLSRFGNGAKSFRELTPDAFLPIREAIDLGALT